MVTANSWNSRPRMPLIKSTGMKTAASEMVMDTMVKPISFEPSRAACIGVLPISMWRTMFSSMTMASSTTNPTDRVSAMSVRLFTEKSVRYITANVPTMENGSARLGMIVAEMFRRNRKITRMTRHSVSTRVNLTSLTDSRIDWERSKMTPSSTDAGSCFWNTGRMSRMAWTMATVLVPGWRWMARMTARLAPSRVTCQAATLSFSTLSIASPRSRRYTGAPSR